MYKWDINWGLHQYFLQGSRKATTKLFLFGNLALILEYTPEIKFIFNIFYEFLWVLFNLTNLSAYCYLAEDNSLCKMLHVHTYFFFWVNPLLFYGSKYRTEWLADPFMDWAISYINKICYTDTISRQVSWKID